MRSALQMLGGVAVAGAVAAGSTAFTGTGISLGAGAATGFVGGKITQSVYGATVSAVNYTVDNTVSTGRITAIDVVFNDDYTDGKAVSVTASGGAGFETGGDAFVCGAVVANTNTSTCLVKQGGVTSSTGYVGITSLAITVS